MTSFTNLFFTDHNQNNNNSLSDIRSNSRMRPSSAMAVSSNKHNSLNRRVADQARQFHRQQVPSNTSSSSLPVAPQKSSSGHNAGAQEYSSTSSLGLLVYVLSVERKKVAKAQLYVIIYVFFVTSKNSFIMCLQLQY